MCVGAVCSATASQPQSSGRLAVAGWVNIGTPAPSRRIKSVIKKTHLFVRTETSAAAIAIIIVIHPSSLTLAPRPSPRFLPPSH